MKVRMLDLAAQYQALAPQLNRAVSEVMASGRYILGPAVEGFERAAAQYLGVEHAIGTSSGSDALVVALLALELEPEAEVITSPFSFFATVESVLRVGARPRFVDVNRESLGLDAAAVAAALGPRTRAILAVHLYGYPGDVAALRQLAQERGVALIEDTAQAFGARVHHRCAGTFGELGCFSFQPSKPLGAMGDAGLVVTNSSELAQRCRRLILHGASGKHRHLSVSGNYRLDALQAAVLREKLRVFPEYLSARALRAGLYDRGLSGVPSLILPRARAATQPSYALYTVRVTHGRRAGLVEFLAGRGIETAVHYPEPLHRQPALLRLGHGCEFGSFPEAERAAEEVLSLPLYPELAPGLIDEVIQSVREYLG